MTFLVLDSHWQRYAGLLPDAHWRGDDPEQAPLDCEVWLAQPDLAARLLARGARPSWIQSTWAGVDKLLPALPSPAPLVTGMKGIFGDQMAEYVFAHLLSEARALPHYRQSQQAGQWAPRWPGRLGGHTMAILGTGSIGARLAAVAAGFGMVAIGVSRSGAPVAGFSEVLPVARLPEAAARADVLVSVLPATSATEGLLDGAVFDALPAGATVINVGRGGVVCEASLRAWLDGDSSARAVLNVFPVEPLPAPHWFWQHPQLTLTPHVAALSIPEDVAALFLANLRRFRAGESLDYRIDPERGY